jgi:hypothetical protein
VQRKQREAENHSDGGARGGGAGKGDRQGHSCSSLGWWSNESIDDECKHGDKIRHWVH